MLGTIIKLSHKLFDLHFEGLELDGSIHCVWRLEKDYEVFGEISYILTGKISAPSASRSLN